jgi:hypothetical protein
MGICPRILGQNSGAGPDEEKIVDEHFLESKTIL